MVVYHQNLTNILHN